MSRFRLTAAAASALRQQFDAEEAELILDQESDAVAVAVDLQTWEDEQTAILDAALEDDRQQLRALERERVRDTETRRLVAEADALRASEAELDSEAELELALDSVRAADDGDDRCRATGGHDRAPAGRASKRRRRGSGRAAEELTQLQWAVQCEDAARLIDEEANRGAEWADRDQWGNCPQHDAEMEAAAAEMDEKDRREQEHIALLQLLREIRPRRYLLHAIRVGDVDDVLGCLRAQGGADPSREVNCCTPVWWAAYFGQAEVVRVLAANGAAMDTPCTGPSYPGSSPSRWLRLGPMTPLTIAAAAGDLDVARALVECGASPNAGTYWDRWPLLAAAIFGHTALCHLLLQAGAAANKRTRDGVSVLWICSHYSVRSPSQVALIRALVLGGADPFKSTPHRPPMFSWAT